MADNDSVFNVNDEDLSFALDQDEQNNDGTNQEADAILQTLVGEGKKFKSINDLARSVVHKDLHIKKIEEENRALRQATAETKTVDQILKALNASNGSGNTVPDRVLDNQNVDVNNAPAASVEEVSKKVLEALEAKTAAQTQQNNLSQVKQVLIRQYGADYANVLKAKAEELGMDTDTVDMMARKTPKALFSLLGVQTSPSVSPTPGQTTRTESIAGRGPEKTFSYYEKIRKTDPKRYESRQMQNEIMQEAMRQGPNFYR